MMMKTRAKATALTIDYKLIRDILNSDSELRHFKIRKYVANSISNNNVFSIINDRQKVFYLKIPKLKFEPSHIFSEIAGINTACKLGVSTPHIYKYGFIQNRRFKVPYLILERVNGNALINLDFDCNKEILYRLFKLISLLHSLQSNKWGRITSKDVSYLKTANYSSFISDIFNYSIQKGLNSLNYRFNTKINKIHHLHTNIISSELLNVKNFVFTHKDLNFKHIFLDSKNNISVIDWEWSLFLDDLCDYAVLLCSILLDADYKSFLIGLDILKDFKPDIDLNLLNFHLGRELYFSAIFGHRQLSIKEREKEIEKELDYSINFLSKVK